MKILQDYTVSDRLRLSDTGPEAAVGDLVKLFLNTQANPSFPAFIYGIIQHPIVRVSCNNSTAYDISYNETDLLGSAAFIRPGDVIDATVTVGPADHAVALNRSSADAHPISAITGLVTALAGKRDSVMLTFANDAAADAALASGTLYKLTGSRQVFQRP